MALLIAGLIVFLGVHSVRILADDWRTAQIARIGPTVWKGGYALISLIGLVLIVYGYGLARQTPIVLYTVPAWTRHVAALLTLVAFVLIAAAYVPKTRIKAKIKHPMVAGVKVWAFAHLLANGSLADVILFGSFLAWAILNYSAAMRRDRNANVVYASGPVSRDFVAV
ncbi:MAG TPA: NnrU family protein, partial [Burkholderiaceae bacterium]|nr:NnrU family protein [Burkholderiaceae bacterium]